MSGSRNADARLAAMPASGTAGHIHSLSRRLAIGLASAVGMISAATFLVLYLVAVREQDADLASKADESTAYLVSALELPLWHRDSAALETLSRTIFQNPSVAGVVIADAAGSTIHAVGDNRTVDGFTRAADIHHQGALLGKIRIHFTTRYAKQHRYYLLFSYATGTIFVLASIIVFTHLLIRKFLKEPIAALSLRTNIGTSRAYDSRFVDPPCAELQPFDKLFTEMAKKIEEQSRVIQDAEEKTHTRESGLNQPPPDQAHQLAASEKRIHQLFEHKMIGMAITSPEKGWVQVNDKVCEMLGYSREELMRMNWADMTWPEDLPADVAQFERMMRGEIDNYALEKHFVRKDGSIICTHLTAGCVRRADHSVDYVLAFLKDISERKLVEENIKKLNTELKQRANALEDANRELESFSYSVSHDLRTPLRAIDGFSQILLEDYAGKLDDEGKRLLNVVRDNAVRMGQLIDDILKFSRASRLELNFSEIDMARLAREVFDNLRAADADATIKIEIAPIPRIRGDRSMMRQVFVNLLSNAIKFSRGKESSITVGGTIEGDEATYFVRDKGVGFDMQYYSKLFGVFQRLHGANEFEGTGIGLAIVKRIITRHGGRVWAEGKSGSGATFYFSLPHVVVS
jgi:PAS domain S-box-containing protein